MAKKQIPDERIFELRERLSLLSGRSIEKKEAIHEFAKLYNVSVNTVYRNIRERKYPKQLRRSDYGNPRIIEKDDLEEYCQIIAALKLRTNNKKGHHLSTPEAIRILEEGVQTPKGLIKVPKSLLKKSTINFYLKKWGYNLEALGSEPVVKRFQANYSNECWQFDLSPSDLKDMSEWPEWVNKKSSRPVLMLYSIVDDRSGLTYQEYHTVFGEDVEAALRFLYRAMSEKNIEGFPFQGRPEMIYMDNGPIAKSGVFQRVMKYLGISIKCHLPRGKDGRRTTARSKGKVERPFRSVKEMHETLFHFHKPQNIEQANEWLMNFILRYNEREHRSEVHSKTEDWIKNLPSSGIRKMCSWERFTTFAREPERRRIGKDARITINGVQYETSNELADQEAILWWGLFDNELFVEMDDKKYGPYQPIGGPIPLHKYRTFKKTKSEKQADQIIELSKQIQIPISLLDNDSRSEEALLRKLPNETPMIDFEDPDPFEEIFFSSKVSAKLAISNTINRPLAELPEDERCMIDDLLNQTLNKSEVLQSVETMFKCHKPLRLVRKRRINDT